MRGRNRSATPRAKDLSLESPLDQALEGSMGACLIALATGERILQGAAQARGATPSEVSEDITRDLKLDSKKFGDRAKKVMLVLTAQLAMSNSLRVNICESVCLFRVALPQDCKRVRRQSYRTPECKTRKTAYHLALKNLPKKDMAKQSAPYLITAEATIETFVTIANERMHPRDPDRLVMSQFSAFTLIENENDKALGSIRFCRVRNKYDEVIELAPQLAIDWYTSFRRTLIQHENAIKK